MADHIRNCPRCLAGFPCTVLDGMLGQLTEAEVIEAATQVVEERRTKQIAAKRYMREYMRKYRGKE